MASVVGEPLFLDGQTRDLQRCSYTRVCVRIQLDRRLPTGVWAVGLNGCFFQPIHYEGIPLIYQSCGGIGHRIADCSSVGRDSLNTQAIATSTLPHAAKPSALAGLDSGMSPIPTAPDAALPSAGQAPSCSSTTVPPLSATPESPLDIVWTVVHRRRNRSRRSDVTARAKSHVPPILPRPVPAAAAICTPAPPSPCPPPGDCSEPSAPIPASDATSPPPRGSDVMIEDLQSAPLPPPSCVLVGPLEASPIHPPPPAADLSPVPLTQVDSGVRAVLSSPWALFASFSGGPST
ncbi:vegetative cell wall protein gp1-like [Dendrobium catenatum]|uniref:vegetative cell wall protein gp1-like n=1 Tax=Dendrobium catenatum TaxID=906689 RepID=UPI0009F49DF5|nr:vegetative cell wall protein gp1-like [Dendrobium catenatum]